MMLFIRLSWPANVPLPPYCGVRRVMSLMRPETVGSTASSSRDTDVAAPVRVELNTGLDSLVTVTVSATVATPRLNDKSCTTPRVSVIAVCSSERNPDNAAVTLYGPPMRMPWIEKRPSADVTAS